MQRRDSSTQILSWLYQCYISSVVLYSFISCCLPLLFLVWNLYGHRIENYPWIIINHSSLSVILFVLFYFSSSFCTFKVSVYSGNKCSPEQESIRQLVEHDCSVLSYISTYISIRMYELTFQDSYFYGFYRSHFWIVFIILILFLSFFKVLFFTSLFLYLLQSIVCLFNSTILLLFPLIY